MTKWAVFSVPAALIMSSSLLIGSESARAASLNKDECIKLLSLYKNLRKTEEVKAMTKGFEWVKENIKEEKLVTIKNFIETEEQLKFRCPGIKWVNTFPVAAGKKGDNKSVYIPPLPRRKQPGDEKPLKKAS